MQFFKPENDFEVRQALIAAGRGDRIGGRDGLIPTAPAEGGETAAGERGPLPRDGESGEGRESGRAGAVEQWPPAGAEDAAAAAGRKKGRQSER